MNTLRKSAATIAGVILASLLLVGVACGKETEIATPKYMPCHSEGSQSCWWDRFIPEELP